MDPLRTFLGSNIFGLVYFNLFSGQKDTTTIAKEAEEEEDEKKETNLWPLLLLLPPYYSRMCVCVCGCGQSKRVNSFGRFDCVISCGFLTNKQKKAKTMSEEARREGAW